MALQSTGLSRHSVTIVELRIVVSPREFVVRMRDTRCPAAALGMDWRPRSMIAGCGRPPVPSLQTHVLWTMRYQDTQYRALCVETISSTSDCYIVVLPQHFSIVGPYSLPYVPPNLATFSLHRWPMAPSAISRHAVSAGVGKTVNFNSQADDAAAALDAVKARFIERNPISLQSHKKAVLSLPGGNTRTLLHTTPFPLFMKHGRGHQVFDEDGHV